MDNGTDLHFLQVRIEKDIYNLFKALCHSHGINLSKGITWAMRSTLFAADLLKAPGGKPKGFDAHEFKIPEEGSTEEHRDEYSKI
jgi:hypothetical protein